MSEKFEIVEMGDARVETKQRNPGGPHYDSILSSAWI